MLSLGQPTAQIASQTNAASTAAATDVAAAQLKASYQNDELIVPHSDAAYMDLREPVNLETSSVNTPILRVFPTNTNATSGIFQWNFRTTGWTDSDNIYVVVPLWTFLKNLTTNTAWPNAPLATPNNNPTYKILNNLLTYNGPAGQTVNPPEWNSFVGFFNHNISWAQNLFTQFQVTGGNNNVVLNQDGGENFPFNKFNQFTSWLENKDEFVNFSNQYSHTSNGNVSTTTVTGGGTTPAVPTITVQGPLIEQYKHHIATQRTTSEMEKIFILDIINSLYLFRTYELVLPIKLLCPLFNTTNKWIPPGLPFSVRANFNTTVDVIMFSFGDLGFCCRPNIANSTVGGPPVTNFPYFDLRFKNFGIDATAALNSQLLSSYMTLNWWDVKNIPTNVAQISQGVTSFNANLTISSDQPTAYIIYLQPLNPPVDGSFYTTPPNTTPSWQLFQNAPMPGIVWQQVTVRITGVEYNRYDFYNSTDQFTYAKNNSQEIIFQYNNDLIEDWRPVSKYDTNYMMGNPLLIKIDPSEFVGRTNVTTPKGQVIATMQATLMEINPTSGPNGTPGLIPLSQAYQLVCTEFGKRQGVITPTLEVRMVPPSTLLTGKKTTTNPLTILPTVPTS